MKRIVSIILFITVLPFSSYAQSTGEIQGTVTDKNGAKIPGARLTLLTSPGLQSSTTTDETGKFEFRGLISGTYLLEADAAGFAPYTHDEIRLARGESKQLQITLEVASVTESVVVTANGTAERIEEAAKVVSVIDRQQI